MRRSLVCILSPGLARAELRRGATIEWAAEAEWSDEAGLAEAIASLAGRPELQVRQRQVSFRVAGDLCQVRHLGDLPPVPRKALVELITLSPHRYFRRGGAPLVLDAAWVGPRKNGRAVAVALSVPLANAIVRGAREAGLVLAEIAPLAAPAGVRLSLLPPDEEARRTANALRWTRRLGLAAAAAWVTLGASLVLAQLVERHRINARLTELQGPLASVLAAEAAEDSAARMIRRIDQENAAEGEVVSSLFRIAAALPDSSFLTQVRVDTAGVGLVAGAARRPAAVLAALEGRAQLVTPRFQGRTSRDVVAGRPVERFAIGFGTREEDP